MTKKYGNDPFHNLVSLMARLRAPGGCPWDRKQTHTSIARNMLEEAHEAYEAIFDGSPAHLMEELGDVLLQVIFHAQMAAEKKRFTLDDVCRVIHEKLVRRHPHVFGDLKLKNASAVIKNWERIKMEERKAKGSSKGVLDGIPSSLSALIKAYRMGEKAGRVGFDWPNAKQVWKKVREEFDELEREIDRASASRIHSASTRRLSGGRRESSTESFPLTRIEEEMGDLLFTLTQLARHLKIDPERAAGRACNKFRDRFRKMELRAQKSGRALADLSMSEKERFWEQAK